MKFFLLQVFVFFLNEDVFKKKEELPVTQQKSQRRRWRVPSKVKFQNTNLVTTTLIANSLSYTAITLILLIRNR